MEQDTIQENEPKDQEHGVHQHVYSIQGDKQLTTTVESINSVYLAPGLFIDPDEMVDQIPARHSGSFKATFRWFLEVCFAGLGTLGL